MEPGFLRGVRFPLILILALLVVYLFFYKSNPAEVKTDVSQMVNSIQDSKHQQNSDKMHQNLAQVISGLWPIYIFLLITR